MRILLSNDDGIDAEGIRELMKAIGEKHEVVVVAPCREQSAMSHALSMRRPLEVLERPDLEESFGVRAISVDGTPADCVKLYLEGMEHHEPELVISGINNGANLATDVIYSGTVGAAREGFLHGIPALAVSLLKNSDIGFERVAEIVADLIEGEFRPGDVPFFYNVNFPQKFKGEPRLSYSRLGRRDYLNPFKKTVDEEGRVYYTVGGEPIDKDCGEGTDIFAANGGLISVTPLLFEATDFSHSYFNLDKVYLV